MPNIFRGIVVIAGLFMAGYCFFGRGFCGRGKTKAQMDQEEDAGV